MTIVLQIKFLLYLCKKIRDMSETLDIKAAIRAHGLTVQEVADRMKITRVTLSSHINGNPSVEILGRIAEAIGCRITELFASDEETNSSIVCPNCGTTINIKVSTVKR